MYPVGLGELHGEVNTIQDIWKFWELLSFQNGYSYRPLREKGKRRDPRVENLFLCLLECWRNSSSWEEFLESSFVHCGASPPPLAKLLCICLLSQTQLLKIPYWTHYCLTLFWGEFQLFGCCYVPLLRFWSKQFRCHQNKNCIVKTDLLTVLFVNSHKCTCVMNSYLICYAVWRFR